MIFSSLWLILSLVSLIIGCSGKDAFLNFSLSAFLIFLLKILNQFNQIEQIIIFIVLTGIALIFQKLIFTKEIG